MKHKELIILLTIFLLGCKTIKQSYPIEKVNLYPIGKNGFWGFVDEHGKIEIPYQFEKTSFFIGDRASVKHNGKYGFINKKGEFLIKPIFDSIEYFTHEIANVVKHGKQISIDRKGKKLKEGIKIVGCGTGIEYVSNPNDLFEQVGGKYILKEKAFENQKRLDPTAKFKIDDFTFDNVIPFSSKSVVVMKDNKFDIFVHYNSVGLKGICADEIAPNFKSLKEVDNLIQANNAKFRVGEKWGLVSNLGDIELDPEFYEIEMAQGLFYLVEYEPKHWGSMTLRKRYFKQKVDQER